LLDKGVNCPSTCAMCEENYEDASHVLFDCPKARNVWLICSLVDKVNSVMRSNNTVAEIIFALLQELTKEKAEQFAVNLWSLWKSRNLRIWQNVSETCQTITACAGQLLHEWRAANNRKQSCGLTGNSMGLLTAAGTQPARGNGTVSAEMQWIKPQQGRLKCNVDASFSEALNRVGIGLCIRDADGNFIKAKTLWSSPMCLPEVGEAKTISCYSMGARTTTYKCGF
jgi:hypothetical protein